MPGYEASGAKSGHDATGLPTGIADGTGRVAGAAAAERPDGCRTGFGNAKMGGNPPMVRVAHTGAGGRHANSMRRRPGGGLRGCPAAAPFHAALSGNTPAKMRRPGSKRKGGKFCTNAVLQDMCWRRAMRF